MFLIKEKSNNFFNQGILFSYLGKAKRDLKKFPSPDYKTDPPPPPPPISSKNFPSPPLQLFLKNLIPPLYEGRGSDYEKFGHLREFWS